MYGSALARVSAATTTPAAAATPSNVPRAIENPLPDDIDLRLGEIGAAERHPLADDACAALELQDQIRAVGVARRHARQVRILHARHADDVRPGHAVGEVLTLLSPRIEMTP